MTTTRGVSVDIVDRESTKTSPTLKMTHGESLLTVAIEMKMQIMSLDEAVTARIDRTGKKTRIDIANTAAVESIQLPLRIGSSSRYPPDLKPNDRPNEITIPTSPRAASEELGKRKTMPMTESGRGKSGKTRKRVAAPSAVIMTHQKKRIRMEGRLTDLRILPLSLWSIHTSWSVRLELRREYRGRTNEGYRWTGKLGRELVWEDESATNTRTRQAVKLERLAWKVRGKPADGVDIADSHSHGFMGAEA